MPLSSGKRVGRALGVVARLHADTSLLLRDCDKVFSEESKSDTKIIGLYVTKNLTWSITDKYWMAEGVYRYYQHKTNPSVFEGVTVAFHARDEKRLIEPTLIIGRIEYLDSGARSDWDLWNLYFKDAAAGEFGKIHRVKEGGSTKALLAVLIAVPLLEVGSRDEIQKLRDEIDNRWNDGSR